MKRVRITTRASFVTSAALDTCPGASSPSGRTKCVSCRPSGRRLRVHHRGEGGEVGRDRERERVGGIVRRLDQRGLDQVADRQALAAAQPDGRLADGGGARVDLDDVRELVVLERHEHRHQLRDRRDRQPRVRPRRGEHLAGARVLDDVGAAVDLRRGGVCREAATARRRACEQERAFHRSRIFSPMKSEVDGHIRVETRDRRHGDTGLGRDDAERVAGLNDPECLGRHGRRVPLGRRRGRDLLAREGRDGGGTGACVVTGVHPGADEDDRHRRCEQERGRSRIAAPVVAAHYQPEAAQTSRFSRDASAPAASRKSVPASLDA